MSVSERPTPRGSSVDITGDEPMLHSAGTDERIRHSFEHLVDAFAAFTALRDGSGQVVEFPPDYANERARAVTRATLPRGAGERPAEPLVGRHRRDLFDEFCPVAETGRPLDTQSLDYEDAAGDGEQVARAFEVRAEGVGDGLGVVWRDATGHVRMDIELERRNGAPSSLPQPFMTTKQSRNAARVACRLIRSSSDAGS